MSGWLFALEKEDETALADVTTAGSKTIALVDADMLFAAGELLFVSEADGSETEYLGAVVTVSPTSVEFGLALRNSKNSGALLWKAKQSLAIYAKQGMPIRRDFQSGVKLLRSLGGTYFAIEVAEPTTRMELELEGLTPATEAVLFDWVQTTTGGGLKAFTLVRPDRTIQAVRLIEQARIRLERKGSRFVIRLPLEIEGEGQYR